MRASADAAGAARACGFEAVDSGRRVADRLRGDRHLIHLDCHAARVGANAARSKWRQWTIGIRLVGHVDSVDGPGADLSCKIRATITARAMDRLGHRRDCSPRFLLALLSK